MIFINRLFIFLFFILVCFSSLSQSQSIPPTRPPGGGGMIPPQLRCPSPLVYVNFTGREEDKTFEKGYQVVGNTSCVLPCPSLVFSEEDWTSFFDTSLYSGSVSLFCALFLIITYSPLVNQKHTRHTVGIFFMLVGIFLMASTNGRLLWDKKGDFSRVCPEPGRFARTDDRSCLATGIFFQFGSLITIFWWATLSFDIYLTIKKVKISDYIIYVYAFVVNAIAILLTFVPLAKTQYGASNFGIGCWVLDMSHQLTFWSFLGLCILAGCVFVCLIVYEIYKTSGSVQKKLLNKHYKPIVLVFIFICQFFYMLIFILYTISNRDRYNGQVTDYVTCLMMNARNPLVHDICQIQRSIPKAGMIVFFLFPRLLGLEMIIFYGFTKGTKRIWLKSFWLNNKYVMRFRSSIQFSSSSKSSSTSGNNITELRKGGSASYVVDSSQFEVTTGNEDQVIELCEVDNKNKSNN